MKFIFIIALGVLVSCGSTHKDNPNVIPLPNSSHSLVIPNEFASNQKARDNLTSAAIFTINDWEGFNKQKLDPTVIVITVKQIEYNNGTEANGVWLGGNTVEVWSGTKMEMPALFHELNHREYKLYDHSDVLRWKAWDTEGNKCYQTIDNGR